VRWRFETGEQDVGRAATGDGMVCFTAKSDVIGLEAATGRVRWRGAVGGEVRGDLVVANGVAYVGCDSGRVYAYAVKGT
jgi:outer membrane protein assembly factor BamB